MIQLERRCNVPYEMFSLVFLLNEALDGNVLCKQYSIVEDQQVCAIANVFEWACAGGYAFAALDW